MNNTKYFGLTIVALTAFTPATTHAVTFEQAALAAGYSYGTTGPIDVSARGIVSLSGVQKYAACRYIHANDNSIPRIDAYQFTGMTALYLLNLERNQIASVESADSSGLSYLGKFYLSFNQLNSIESGDFSELPRLNSLSLARKAL